MDLAPNEMLERFKFKQCRQKDGHKIKTFFEELKKTSTYCNFGANQNQNLRDQFVWGLREETLQKRLLREKDLDVIKAVEMATTFEQAGRGAEGMLNSKKSGSGESTQTSALNFIAGKKSKNFGKHAANGARRATNSRKCFCCGKGNHIATECKHRSYECNTCHKVGHLASVCKANSKGNTSSTAKSVVVNDGKSSSNNKQHFIDECDLAEDFNNLFMIDEEKTETINAVKRFETTVLVNEVATKFQIDTGSPITAISKRYRDNNSVFKTVKLRETDRKFKSYTGDPIIPVGILEVNIKNNVVQRKLELFVMPGNGVPIIGRDWLSFLNIIQELPEKNVTIKKIEGEHNDSVGKIVKELDCLFAEGLGTYNKGNFKLNLKEGATPVYRKPRPISYAMRRKIEAEIDRLVKEGVLVAVESSEWATPIVPVLKSNGQIVIGGDYKTTLNPWLKIDRHPIPRTQDLLSQLRGNSVFSKLHMSNAYKQVELWIIRHKC